MFHDCGNFEEADTTRQKGRTATSLAAFRIAGRAPPAFSTSRARRSAGKRTGSGAAKSSRPSAMRSSGAIGVAIRAGQARQCAIGTRMSEGPSWASIDPST